MGAGVSSWRGRGRLHGAPGFDAPLTSGQQNDVPERRRIHAWEVHQERLARAADAQLQMLDQLLASIGGLTSALTKPPSSDVLFSGTLALRLTPAGTYGATLEFKQPLAYVAVYDVNGVGPVTIVDSASSFDAPTNGPGVFVIGQGIAMGFPLRANALTFVTSTDLSAESDVPPYLPVAVFSRPREPFAGFVFL